MLEQLKKSDFEGLLSEIFKIQLPTGETVDAELIEVSSMGSSPIAENEATKRAPFSIIFRSQDEPALEQSIYRIEHPSLETVEIFLVPIGPDGKGMRYEAVFN